MLILLSLVYLIFSYGLLYSKHICEASHSSIEWSNGYRGIIVAFSPKIDSSQASKIVEDTKNLIIRASNALKEATGGEAYFSEVTFVVPKSWTVQNDTSLTRYSDADIIITDRVSSVRSFTMQFAGCGQYALPIVVSKDLTSQTDDMTAKLLVHEWAHYRYGVFNEFGFASDPLYPVFYSIPGSDRDDVKITSCTDGHESFNYKSAYENGNNCDTITNNMTGLPTTQSAKCIPLPTSENAMQSSLMYSHSVTNITKFCGVSQHEHNVNSPNKHNFLCNGLNTWSIIKSHLDSEKSKSKTSQSTKEDITFKYWKDTASSIYTLIGVANSKAMEDLQRLEWINVALSKFVKVDLPKSNVGIFTFNGDDVDMTNTPFWQTADQINDGIVPSSQDAKPIDFKKVLDKGREKFPKDSGGTFIVLIGGTSIKPIQEIESAATDLRTANIKLKIIVYPLFVSLDDREHASELFKKVISITGGSITYIREDKVSQKSSASTLTQLLKAFESVNSDFSGSDTTPYHVISEQIFQNPKNITFTFNVDTSIKDKQLRVYFIQTLGGALGGLIRNAVLTRPDGTNDIQVTSFGQYGNIRGFKPSIESFRSGQWQLSAQAVPPSSSESVVTVAEFGSLIEDSITAKCWLSSEVEHDPSKPLLVYVQVMDGIEGLIEDASVQFNLVYEDGFTVRTSDLLDDGLGDPDITKGDGIYSQYIVDMRKTGYYYITATVGLKNEKVIVTSDFGSTSLPVNHNTKYCCGSKVSGGQSKDFNEKFNRVVDCGSIFVTKDWPIENYPPNTIRDLRIERVDYFNRTVYLKWTSPGGDFTLNNADKYVIKVFHGNDNDPNLRKDIISNFDSKSSSNVDIEPVLPAQGYGKEQRAEIRVRSEEGGMYYFAMKSYDKENHGSDVSNIVVAHIKSNVLITSTTALSNEVSKTPVDGSGGGGGSAKLAGMEWWEILAICIACAIVLVFVIIISICFMGKRRRKNEEESETRVDQLPQRRAPDPPRISPPLLKIEDNLENGSLTHSVEKIPNTNIVTNTNNNYNSGSQPSLTQPSLRELNVNTLSPVQSWDAKDLLSHWGRVQEAKQRQQTPPVMRIEDLESTSSNHSRSYASSEDDNAYTNPAAWRYHDASARPPYHQNSYPEPALRSSLDHSRSNTPTDAPRYSVIRKPTTTVSQV